MRAALPCWQRFLPSAARRVKAPWQTARYACRLARRACRSSFPKISLRCDFREPYILKRACLTDQEVADANPAARQHKTPQKVNLLRRFVVEVTGLEPTTSWSLTKRATKLRYTSVLPFKNSIIYYT